MLSYQGRRRVSLPPREEQDTTFHPSLAATVNSGLLGTGDELFREKPAADAQTISCPIFVVPMIDDLDKQSMERRKRGEDGEEQQFRGAGGSGSPNDRCTLDAWLF
jgi:hypothetical protein